MEYQKIEKVYDGNYLDYYLVTYRDEQGREKVYEMVSRDKEIDSREKLYDHSTDAEGMIVHDPGRGDRRGLVLQRGGPPPDQNRAFRLLGPGLLLYVVTGVRPFKKTATAPRCCIARTGCGGLF